MGQHNPQSNPSGHQKMPGHQDDKQRHSQAKEQQPNRSGQNQADRNRADQNRPGSNRPQREQDE